jgi:gliding motility-associated-like protein
MQRFLVLLIFLFTGNPDQAQNSFSFHCTRDTTISCISTGINLHATIPDIYSSTNAYSVNSFSTPTCFRGYVSPANPGTSANLVIDDRYSPLIDISFPFSFYGTTYSKLAASTNGFLTFDNSKALTFSHYGILANGAMLSSTTGTPQDLPSSLYDGAIIMGPYHDLDPNNPNNTTASQQIKVDVVGTSPYRKWIISYYNVPLYTTACLNLATNTHQIVLYETLNIVEVFIYDKAICPNWNNGRSMIGMQDMSKSNAIMAPGRQASSAPWGTTSMNESWRFVPATGNSLFIRSELYLLSGAFIANGVASPAGNKLLDIDFGNINPGAGGNSYVVKSFYKNPDGSANDIIATDTINILRGETITTSTTTAGCAGSNSGTLTITSPVGAGYEYSLDGINWQTVNTFNVSAGNYTVRVRNINSSCISTKTISITNATLTASLTIVATQCTGPPTGSITVTPQNGTAPYMYSLNGSPFQTSNSFTSLPAGNYTIVVKDALGCSYTKGEIIGKDGPVFTVDIVKPICGGSPTGTVTVNATGTPPFSYAINTGAPQTSNVFTNVTTGTHTIFVYDATSCSSALNITVTSDIIIDINASITMPTCPGGSDGAITANPGLGTPPYQYALDGGAFQSGNKFSNLDTGVYKLTVKDFKGCLKDTSVTVLQPNEFKITAITTKATTCASLDGQIAIKANGGTTPYMYSIDNGSSFSVNNLFTTRSGMYSLVVKDNKGCTTLGSATVESLSNDMILELGPDKTLCQYDSIVIVPTSTPPADYFRWSLPAGLNDTTSGSPKASPADTTKYHLLARSGFCERMDSVTINVLHKPIPDAGADTVICNGTFAFLKGSATNLSGTVKYTWLPSAEMTTPYNSSTMVKPKDSRINYYTLQVSDNYGCNFKVYDQVKVNMKPPVPAFAGNDTIATIGVPFQLNATGGVSFAWAPPMYLNNPYIPNPIAVLPKDIRFTVTVEDSAGCAGTSSVLIKAYKDATYYIPNAFTPNGDGLNDTFNAIAPGIVRTFYFRIYNRWGKIMFETQDTRKGWDGTYRGIKQPSAVYVWIIKGVNLKGEMIDRKGMVTLIR